MAFFLIQAVFCTIEQALRAVGSLETRAARVPSWVKVLLSTAMLVPFSPLFMAPLRDGGTLDAMLAAHTRLVVDTGPMRACSDECAARALVPNLVRHVVVCGCSAAAS